MTREFRPRYILFSISSDETLNNISRNDMIACLRLFCKELFNGSLKEKRFFLTRFNGKHGILRCQHTEKQAAINLLQSIKSINDKAVHIKTIATSGTIKTLIKKQNLSQDLKK